MILELFLKIVEKSSPDIRHNCTKPWGTYCCFLSFENSTLHHNTKAGWLLGVFFSGLFTIRFIVEFVKESQGGFEEFMPMFSTGQWLSIPLIIGGLILTIYAQRKAQ